MNTDLYRLVFNARRGMYTPTAECLPARHGGRARPRSPSRPRLTTLACVLACTFAPPLLANPLGAQVIHGSAHFSQSGPVLTIHNSANAILNWQQFSIQPGETTRFIQPDATSAVLNRVIGPDPSQILGTLSSNGRVFLVNPAGILVGEGARIDVAGLVASTLPMTDADFLAGRLKFGDGLLGGDLVQRGRITTPEGGRVLLVGRNVSNAGQIHSPRGETLLAAGETVEVLDSATPNVKVRITGVDGQLTNLGEIVADAGRIGLAGALVRNSGTLNASSAVNEGGRIFLRATRRIDLEETSRINADGIRGGELSIRSEDAEGRLAGELIVRGELSAQGNGAPGTGGYIETSAARFDVRDVGVYTAGGEWLLDPYDITITNSTNSNIASGGGSFTSTGDNAILSTASIEAALNNGTNVTVSTGSDGSQPGNITISSPILKSGGGNATLTFNAHNDIYLNASISSQSNALDLVFNPDSDNTGGGALYINVSPVILALNGGTLTFNGSKTTNIEKLLILQNTTWTNTGTINFNNDEGLLNLDGTTLLTNSSAGTINLNNTQDGQVISGQGQFNNAGSLIKTTGSAATLIISADFDNTGMITIEAGTLETTKLPTGGAQNGIIDVADGAIYHHSSTGGLLNNGTLRGTGIIKANGTITNAAGGLIQPAGAEDIGTLTLDTTNDANAFINQGTLSFDISGPNHDVLWINNASAATLQGTVQVYGIGSVATYNLIQTYGTITDTSTKSYSGPYQAAWSVVDSQNDFPAYLRLVLSNTPPPAANVSVVAHSLNKVYGDPDPLFTYTQSGDPMTLTGALARASGENVGEYSIQLGSLACTSPCNLAFTPGLLTISPATLTYIANLASREYGEPNPTFTGSVTGFKGSDTLQGSTTGTLTFTTSATPASPVGTYPILGSGLTASNYVFAQHPDNSSALTVTPATLTYLADLVSREQYDPIAPLTGTVTGFKNNDTLQNSTTGTLTFSTEASRESPPGQYAVLGSGLTPNNGNYVLQQAESNATALTVTPPVHFTWIGETGGAWSDASKWNKARPPFPDSVVRLPVTGIDVRFDAGEATVRSLESSSAFTLAGGMLNVTDFAAFTRLALQAGTLNAGQVNVSESFQAGAGFMNVAGTADITQLNGDLILAGIRAGSLHVSAPAGAIRQTGPLSASGLHAEALAAIELDNLDNRFGVLHAKSLSGGITLGNTTPDGQDWTEIEEIDAVHSVNVLNTGGMRLGEGRSVRSQTGDIALATRSPLSIFGNIYSNQGSVYLTAGNNGTLTIGSSAFVLAGSGTVLLSGGSIFNQGTFSNGQGPITPGTLLSGGASPLGAGGNLPDLYENTALLDAPQTLEPHPPVLPVLSEPLPNLLDDTPEVHLSILKELDASARLDDEEERKKTEGTATTTTDEGKDDARKPELCIC